MEGCSPPLSGDVANASANMTEWSNDDALMLIEEYKKHKLLWDPKDKWHFNKNKKSEAWNEIAKSCKADPEETKKKMASLLGSFRREKSKGKKIIGMGPDAKEVYKTSWFAFKSLLFLIHRDKSKFTFHSHDESNKIFLNEDSADNISEDNSFSQSTTNFAEEESLIFEDLKKENLTKMEFRLDEDRRKISDFFPPVKKQKIENENQSTIPITIDKLLEITNNAKLTTEFDVFGNSVAAQLSNMSLVDAVKLQLEIQQLITQHRLKLMEGES